MPVTSSTDRAIKAIQELTHCIKNPAPVSPFNNYGEKTEEALQKLKEIFSKHATQTRVNQIPTEIEKSPRMISKNITAEPDKTVHVISINKEHEDKINKESKKSINKTISPNLKEAPHIIPDNVPFRYNTRRYTKLTKVYANAAHEL